MTEPEVPVSISLLASLRDSATKEEADAAIALLVELIPNGPPKSEDDEYYVKLYRSMFPAAETDHPRSYELHVKAGRRLAEQLWHAGFELPKRRET